MEARNLGKIEAQSSILSRGLPQWMNNWSISAIYHGGKFMPQCKKCSDIFPNFMMVEGKQRNLSKRSYCTACSPFGSHNTRKVEVPQNTTCLLCRAGTERGRKLCKGCIVKVRRWRLKVAAIYYLGGKCQNCDLAFNGYNLSLFDFHHRNGDDKDYAISESFQSAGWQKLQLELDKCQLLCCYCHRLTHCLLDDNILDIIYDYDGDWDLGAKPTRKLSHSTVKLEVVAKTPPSSTKSQSGLPSWPSS